MSKTRVLFVCVHNSARSQMAEALLKKIAGDKFEVESAGLEPGTLNPLAVEAMKEIGIDISQNRTKSVKDFFEQGKHYDYVITLCDASQSNKCPFFPGTIEMLNWSFDDPAGFKGAWEQKLAQTRKVRDQIQTKIKDWLNTLKL